jgi:phytoene dehydrogenase-like protein
MQGLIRTIENTFLSLGGELRLGHPVKKILLKGGSAAGVQTAEGDIFRSRWVVSNADTKKTLLEFFDEGEIPSAHISKVLSLPYTDSELCVYAGVDPGKVNWKALKARHLFYRHKLDTGTPPGLTDFENREIAITMWSDNMEGLAPPAKKSLVLRIGFPYSHFSDFWTGEKKRRAEYVEYKNRLSESVVRVVENILPGLRASIEFMEAATPLTYQDWGNRYRGSIAGWSWDAKSTHALGNKLLIRTPIPNLLMAGIYAASELFLGGIPTAVHTGCLAAEHICKKKGQPPD